MSALAPFGNHAYAAFRPQRYRRQILDVLPRHQSEPEFLSDGGQQQHCFHHRKARTDANARPSAKWEIGKAWQRHVAMIARSPAVRVKSFRLRKISSVPVSDQLRHQDI